MLACAESKCDRIKAFVSIAETARELNDFEKAYQCYSVIESIENTLTLENKKVKRFDFFVLFKKNQKFSSEMFLLDFV